MQNHSAGRDIAMVAAGIAVGVVGSRLLPPITAIGAGAIRGRQTGDPFQKLEHDHRFILETLRAMEHAHDTDVRSRIALFLTLKRKLAKHALAEEDIVYPLLQDEADRREATMHLYEEHAGMKILLFEMETAVMHRRPWTEPVTRLRAMVERHAREEEEEQFPRLRQVLDERRFTQVAAQVHREEALIL
jgi:hemerythrin superfamily protein